jgi:hypothetical protein
MLLRSRADPGAGGPLRSQGHWRLARPPRGENRLDGGLTELREYFAEIFSSPDPSGGVSAPAPAVRNLKLPIVRNFPPERLETLHRLPKGGSRSSHSRRDECSGGHSGPRRPSGRLLIN